MTPDQLPTNFQSKTRVHPTTNCWEWTGYRNPKGYGMVTNHHGSCRLTHRAAYELLVAEIPEGMTIDHLCCNPRCIFPEHMEVVTRSENAARRFQRYELAASA